jgi:hypothetical protein
VDDEAPGARMTGNENEPQDEEPSRFPWDSPRWREGEETPPGEVEKHRRDRATDAPAEDDEGAIERE